MSIIDDIRSKSAQMQNSQTILKAFGENETLEKGGKEKPEGTIYTRPDGRKFIKRGGKWVYHRENKGSVKIETPKGEENKKNNLTSKDHYKKANEAFERAKKAKDDETKKESLLIAEKHTQEAKRLELKEIKSDKSGAELKEKVDLAQGGVAGIRALMEREKQTSKKEPEKSEKEKLKSKLKNITKEWKKYSDKNLMPPVELQVEMTKTQNELKLLNKAK